jgi:hypothetical protein
MKTRSLLVAVLLTSGLSAQELSTRFQPAQDSKLKVWETRFRNDKALQRELGQVDQEVTFPRPLPVIFSQTGQVNAWYAPASHQVIFSYELAAHLEELFRSEPRFAKQATAMAQNASRFILMHELGHAVIEEMDLPQTGKNEDAADELAVLMCTRSGDKEGAAAAAQAFLLMGKKYKDATKAPALFYDEHSLDMQRYFHILANLEAAMPGSVPGAEAIFPVARLARARERWPLKVNNWSRHFGNRWTALQPIHPNPNRSRNKIDIVWENGNPQIKQLIQESRLAENITALIEKLWYVPPGTRLIFTSNSGVKCRYDPAQHAVLISWRHLNDLLQELKPHYSNDQELGETWAALFTTEILIRMQQMMLRENNVPFTGEEEDAAVELVTFLMAGADPFYQGMLEVSADYWRRQVLANPDMQTYGYDDEDDLHYQRLMDVFMYLHRNNPTKYAYVEKFIPKRRLERFAREHADKKKSWDRILMQYTPPRKRRLALCDPGQHTGVQVESGGQFASPA